MGYPIFSWDLVLCRKASVLAFVSISLFLFRTSEACNNLTFSGSSFKIAIFADLHYGENAWTDWGPLQDLRSDNVMSRVLDTEKPDFVVYLGDILTANNLPVRNASSYWKRAVSAAKSRNLPWASVFGNHDDMAFEWPLEWFGPSGLPPIQCFSPTLHSGSRTYEHMLELEVSRMDVSSSNDFECYFQRTTRAELIQLDMEEPLSCTLSGNKDLWPSVSNYVLEVYSHNDKGNPSAFLYFLDSGGGSYPEVISARQAKWFKQTSAQKNPNSRVPEIIFWHIPSQAFEKVAPTRNAIRHPCIGSINLEAVAAQEAEWGILDILTNRTSVKAIIVGHNHGLDWCCPYKNLWLCFARHTGYGGYGSWPRGARIVELIQQPFVINSWIRMEDGTVHSQVDLTYV